MPVSNERERPGGRYRLTPARPRRSLSCESLEPRWLLATLRVAAWNTLNMPDDPAQDGYFRTVLEAVGDESIQGHAGAVDILALAETDPASANRLRNVLDALYPAAHYQSVVSSVDFGGDATGFVYNTSTVSLLGSLNMTSGLTHPILRGQFRPAGTGGESDLTIYATHLKSGTDAADVAKRESEMTIIRANADALPADSAVLVTGDFNMQGSSEGAWTVATSAGAAQLRDVMNAPGNWSNNPSFVALHKQNTAFMLRRLDLQMTSNELHDGSGLEYVTDSFRVFGNNGTHGLGNPITAGTGAASTVLQALAAASDHLPVVADYLVPPLELIVRDQSGMSTQVRESGAIDTYRVSLAVAPAADVQITLTTTAELDLGSGPGQPRHLLFTPANALIPQTVVVAAVDNVVIDGTRPVTIGHSVASLDPDFGGLPLDDIPAWIIDDEAPSMVINEVDSDTVGIDSQEFIELYNGGFATTPLNDLVVVLFDGATDQSYASFDLDGHTTDTDGYFVLGNSGVPGVDFVIPGNSLENGPDAVALYQGNASDFPFGSAITITNLLDAVVYDTDDADDLQLLTLLAAGQQQINENGNGQRNTESVARLPDSGIPRHSDNQVALPATPGRPNVPVQAAVYLTEPNGRTTVEEGGAHSSFSLELDSLPTADVLVTITPDEQLDLGAGPGVPLLHLFDVVTGVAPQWIPVMAADDAQAEGPHSGTITFSLSSLDPAYAGVVISDLLVTIVDNDIPPIIINEVDSDTSGLDTMEFVELYDGGRGNTPLSGLAVVFFNGSNESQYAGFNLDGYATDADGFFVLGNPLVSPAGITFPNNTLQNGADAVGLYRGEVADFPSVTTTELIDAVVYDTDDPDDFGLLILLHPGQPQVNESGGGDPTSHAIARVPDGGAPRTTTSYRAQLPTPGAANSGLSGPDGDFNDDGRYDCLDIDALVAEIAATNHSPMFDLNGDGLVDRLDLDAWLAEAGAVNLPSGRPYPAADANLDGVVDGSDFNAWNASKFTLQAAWCHGDFNADGAIDGSDFNIWNSNKFQSADGSSGWRSLSPSRQAYGLGRAPLDSLAEVALSPWPSLPRNVEKRERRAGLFGDDSVTVRGETIASIPSFVDES